MIESREKERLKERAKQQTARTNVLLLMALPMPDRVRGDVDVFQRNSKAGDEGFIELKTKLAPSLR